MFLLSLAVVFGEVQEDVCLLQTRFLQHREGEQLWMNSEQRTNSSVGEQRTNSSVDELAAHEKWGPYGGGWGGVSYSSPRRRSYGWGGCGGSPRRRTSYPRRRTPAPTPSPIPVPEPSTLPAGCGFIGRRRRSAALCSCRRRTGGEMGTMCSGSGGDNADLLECEGGKTYDADQGACVSPTPPPTPACIDEEWGDAFGDDCSWYLANDPGCVLYKDTGQKTHCKAACGVCGDVTAPERSSSRRCATVSDVQSICGKAQSQCTGANAYSGGPCRMNDCDEYVSMVEWELFGIRGLKDGQALGSGYGYEVRHQASAVDSGFDQTVCVTDNDLHICPEGFDCDTNVVAVDRTPAPTPAPTLQPTPAPKDIEPLLWPSIKYGDKCEASAGVEVASADECQAAAAAANHSYYSFLSTTNHCFSNEECQAPVVTEHPWVVHMGPWPELKSKAKCEDLPGQEYDSQAACQLATLAATHHYYSWKPFEDGKWVDLTGLSTAQSSTFDSKGADRAVNDDPDTCAHTDSWLSDNGHAWWKVDLPESHDVFSVRITNTHPTIHMPGVSIYLDGRRCAHRLADISGTVEIPCRGGGKELKIERDDGNLVLCKVMVGIVAGSCFSSSACDGPLDTESNWTIHEDPLRPPDGFDDFFVKSFFIPQFGPNGDPVPDPVPACPGGAVVAEAEAGLCHQPSVVLTSPYADNVAMKSVTYQVQEKDCNATTEADCFSPVADIAGHVWQVGHSVVKVTGEDLSSQTTACLQDVYVYDTEPPVFETDASSVDASTEIEVNEETCYVRDMDAFNAYEASTGFEPKATDNCDQDVLVVRKIHTPNMTLLFDERNPVHGIRGRGSLVMSYVAHDDYSDALALPEKSVHTAFHRVDLTIVDRTPPANISGCPGDIFIEVPATQSEAVVHWDPPVATEDNCDSDEEIPPAVEMSTPTAKAPGMTLPVGVHTATYSFSDTSGNTMIDTCTFKIEIAQKEHEVTVTCPADVTFQTIPHAHFAIVKWDEPQAFLSGQPDASLISYPQGVLSGMPFPFGITYVKVHANHSDASAECVFAVTVTDPYAPEAQGSTYRCANVPESGAEPYDLCAGPVLAIVPHDSYAETFGYDLVGVEQVSTSCCRSEADVEHRCTSLAGTNTEYCLPVY